MDKYQKFALRCAGYSVYNNNIFKNGRIDSNTSGWSYITESNYKIIIKQEENYNIVKYFIIFEETINKVSANGLDYFPESICDRSDKHVVVPVDFEKQIKELTLNFNDVINPITVPVEFIFADRKIYDDKLEKQRQKELEKSANISLSVGVDLVNIYFQPCSSNYSKTTIELWLAEGQYTSHSSVMGRSETFIPKLKIETAKATRMIGKFHVEGKEMFFESITGLAKGAYGVVISQFDNNNTLLFKSEFKYFGI